VGVAWVVVGGVRPTARRAWGSPFFRYSSDLSK
jgi:hypothetical protein